MVESVREGPGKPEAGALEVGGGERGLARGVGHGLGREVGNLSVSATSTHPSLAASAATRDHGDRSMYQWSVLRRRDSGAGPAALAVAGNRGELNEPASVLVQWQGEPGRPGGRGAAFSQRQHEKRPRRRTGPGRHGCDSPAPAVDHLPVPPGRSHSVDAVPGGQHSPTSDHADFLDVMPTGPVAGVVACLDTARHC